MYKMYNSHSKTDRYMHIKKITKRERVVLMRERERERQKNVENNLAE